MKQHPLMLLVLVIFIACNSADSNANENAAAIDFAADTENPEISTTLLAKYPLLG